MAKKLYVGNLTYNVNESDLEALFSQFGTVQSAQIIVDRDTNRSKGFGFIEMETDAQAQAAIENLNGYDHQGRNLTVNEARPREPRSGGGGGGFTVVAAATAVVVAVTVAAVVVAAAIDRPLVLTDRLRRGCRRGPFDMRPRHSTVRGGPVGRPQLLGVDDMPKPGVATSPHSAGCSRLIPVSSNNHRPVRLESLEAGGPICVQKPGGHGPWTVTRCGNRPLPAPGP